MEERRVNAVILSEAKNLGFRFELLAAAEAISGRGLRVKKRDVDEAPKRLVSDPA